MESPKLVNLVRRAKRLGFDSNAFRELVRLASLGHMVEEVEHFALEYADDIEHDDKWILTTPSGTQFRAESAHDALCAYWLFLNEKG